VIKLFITKIKVVITNNKVGITKIKVGITNNKVGSTKIKVDILKNKTINVAPICFRTGYIQFM
jgi:hypothetical protein